MFSFVTLTKSSIPLAEALITSSTIKSRVRTMLRYSIVWTFLIEMGYSSLVMIISFPNTTIITMAENQGFSVSLMQKSMNLLRLLLLNYLDSYLKAYSCIKSIFFLIDSPKFVISTFNTLFASGSAILGSSSLFCYSPYSSLSSSYSSLSNLRGTPAISSISFVPTLL